MIMLIVYLAVALSNLLLMLIFREDFTDTPERKRMFSWICVGATILSFMLWFVCAVIFVYDYFKFYRNGNNESTTTK